MNRPALTSICLFIIFFIITVFSNSLSAESPKQFFIQNHDVVVTWGNSITDDGIYPRILENFILTYYPEWNVEFYNLGWGGDRALNPGRIRRDMMLCKPTKVTIMLGMNDGGYKSYEEATLATYIKGQLDLLDFLKSYTNPEVMLISPTPFDLYLRPFFIFPDGKRDMSEYPVTLARLSSGLHELALIRNLPYVDMNEWLRPIFERIPEVHRNYLITPDGVHPNIEGETLMGYKILKEMGAPVEIMSTIIDAGVKTVLDSKGCTVSDISGSSEGISFVRHDQHLPLPLPPSNDPLLQRLFPLNDNFNRDVLIVRGLHSGNYLLKIDDKIIDKVSAQELSDGINLSEYLHTPPMLQAFKVYEATEKRNVAFWTRWRQIYLKNVGSPTDSTPMNRIETPEVRLLKEQENQAFKEQHEYNVPKVHTFLLSKDQTPDVIQQPQSIPVNQIIADQVSLLLTFDTGLLKSFKAPLYVFANYSYSSVFEWGLYQTKGYYCPPFQMYDDGTHGDIKAGDGIYSVRLFIRKDSPQFRFFIQDEYFYSNYWRQNNQGYRNSYLNKAMELWCKVMPKAEKGNIFVDAKTDIIISYDYNTYKNALEKK